MDKQMIKEMAMNRYKKHILFSERKKLADEYEEWVNKPLEDGSKIKDCALSVITFMTSKGYRKIPEGAVVLTEQEYSDLFSDELNAIERDIAEYWATQDIETVAKELHKDGYRKLDDHAIFVLRKAKGLENKIRKETAEKFAEMAREGAFVDFMGEPIIRASKIDEVCKELTGGK